MLQQELVGTSEYRAERGLAPPSGVEHLNSKAMSAAIPVPKCTQYPVCYRERVRRFYQKYDPKKLESLDAIMLQFAGREDKLIMALLVHYGPEPESEIFEISSTPSPGSDLTLSTARGPVKVARVRPPMSQYRARMQAMYQKYDPEMLGSVDTMLAQYIGKEDELMHKLLARYGPEPEFTGSQRCGSETMPLRTAQRSSVDVCSSRKDNQTALEIRALLTRYYTYYAPENLCNLDHILKTFEGKEDELIRTLHIAFGPAPRDEDLMRRAEQKEHRPSKSEPSDLESEGVSIHMNVTLPEEGIRARLVHMLQVYDPQSLSQLPSLIKQHDNNEEMLLQDLIRRYGPEPQAQDKYADLDTQLTEILNSFNSGSIRRAQKLKCVEHEYRMRVFNMLRFYDPENLTAIDSILINYRGKQNQMMRDLVSRYGPEPLEKLDGGRYLPTYRTYHQRLTRFYAHYDPDRLCEIDEELSYHFGHEEALMRLLCSMYGPEEFSSQSPHPAESVENQISKIELPAPTDSFAAQKQSARRTEVLQASFYFHQ